MEKEHLEILLEDIRGKFDLVLEGHDSLRKEIRDAREESNEKHDLTAFQIKALNNKLDDKTQELHNKIDAGNTSLNKKIDDVEARQTKKIDAVANDLAAHRADTEGHKREYKVSE
ncbi:MAG: hypothetical protein NTV89_05100 [Proteobacteria bacterium]|nr:hypothetical protein [Pseudomonadota bacterium]